MPACVVVLSGYLHVSKESQHGQWLVVACGALIPADAAAAGIYMVEDTLTSYWPDFAGGYRKPGTFLEYRCACWYRVQSQTVDAECFWCAE